MRESAVRAILQDYPEWLADSYICRTDLRRYRGKYVHSLVESEKGELSTLEKRVLSSLESHDLIASNLDAEFEKKLLNLLLSCLAAIQAPIIMMSQNCQEAKDRLRAQHDYQVNLKSELEIRQLNEKIDHLLA